MEIHFDVETCVKKQTFCKKYRYHGPHYFCGCHIRYLPPGPPENLPLMDESASGFFYQKRSYSICRYNGIPNTKKFHYADQRRAGLGCQSGVIAPVLKNIPVTSCSRMGIVPIKQNNKATKLHTHPVESPFVQASRIPPGT